MSDKQSQQKANKRQTTMEHPFTKELSNIDHLKPGDVIMATDLYRSATISVNGNSITPESGALGKWMYAGDVLDGSIINENCNVHFIRLSPVLNTDTNTLKDANQG